MNKDPRRCTGRVAGRAVAGRPGRDGDRPPFSISIIGDIGRGRVFASAAYLAERLEYAAGRPVRLWINSAGGAVGEAHTMIAALAEYPGAITTEAVRYVNSAAVLIYASGDRRIAREGATFSFHKRAIEQVPDERLTAEALRRAADHLTKIDMDCAAYLADRCGVSTAEISKLESQEAILDAYHARRLGLVHEIVEPAAPKPKQDQRAQPSGFVLPGRMLMGISRHAADQLVAQGRLPPIMHSRFRGGAVLL